MHATLKSEQKYFCVFHPKLKIHRTNQGEATAYVLVFHTSLICHPSPHLNVFRTYHTHENQTFKQTILAVSVPFIYLC